MRRSLYAGAVLLAATAAAALVAGPAGAAYAAPPLTGKTVVVGTPTAGVPLTVQVTLYGVYPVVPYDFSLENRCWFGGRFAGPADSFESYPLRGPWYAAGSGATSTETVNLNDVPVGSVCKVSISRSTSPVKGSTTAYSVVG